MNNFAFHKILLMLILSLIPNLSVANDNSLRCSASKPTSKQNININIVGCSYLHQFSLDFISDSLFVYPIVSIGQVITDDDKGSFFGGGLGTELSLSDNVKLFLEGGAHWQDDYEFGERGVAFKDYGGPWQFVGKLGSSYQLSSQWQLGYAYIHMSNGNRYNINPSFNGHSLFASYQF